VHDRGVDVLLRQRTRRVPRLGPGDHRQQRKASRSAASGSGARAARRTGRSARVHAAAPQARRVRCQLPRARRHRRRSCPVPNDCTTSPVS
jgi:hypothetical protein